MAENNEVLEEVYSYQVNTRMPIVGLSVGTLKVPATMKLTKEDVLICVKKAPVFRRFSASDRERVGIGNIDRLHRAEHLSEEEYEAMIDKSNDNRGKVEATIINPNEGKIVIDKNPPSLIADEKKETPVVEEIKAEESVVEESTPVVEETPETIEEVNEVKEVSEEVTEESTETEGESVEENNKNNGYNNKKKHRR